MNTRVLKYDLGTQEISVIHLPPISCDHIVLMAADDGRLGLVRLEESRLYFWSMGAGPDGDVGWAQTRVIDLQMLLPFEPLCHPLEMAGFADAVGVLFMRTVDRVFSIDLNSCKARKVHEGFDVYGVVPFMSFYTPALGATSTGEGPRVGA
uniref:F-box protein AT5G49610-like beta-propeller domain-containing protein n=1 Tax=Arundo donax TaxID=35708 RepID=A0A0A9DH54_ARUDO